MMAIYKFWSTELPSMSQNCGMVQRSSSFHVPDIHIGPILQQEFTSNQRTLWNNSKQTIQHQISGIRAKPVLPSHHWVLWQRKQKGFASISI